MSRWIVMTSKAKMPTYRNIALVKLTQEYAEQGLMPTRIDPEVQGVELVCHWGMFHSSTTTKESAYARALSEAERMADEANKRPSGAALLEPPEAIVALRRQPLFQAFLHERGLEGAWEAFKRERKRGESE